MRSPAVLGAVAGLLTGILGIIALVALIGGQPVVAPTPGAPTAAAVESEVPTAPPTAGPDTPPPVSPGPGTTPPLITSPPEGLQIGERAPRIRLPQIGGGELDTRDYAGRPLWINFMATWCPPCRDELPMMESMQAQLGDEISIVLVDVGEDRQTVAAFIDSLNVDLPTGIDEDGTIQAEWGAYALPVHYWIDADGVVQHYLFGGAPREVFIESLRSVVPEAPVE